MMSKARARFVSIVGAALCGLTPALADDSSATLGAGGLILQKTDKIALVSGDCICRRPRFASPIGFAIDERRLLSHRCLPHARPQGRRDQLHDRRAGSGKRQFHEVSNRGRRPPRRVRARTARISSERRQAGQSRTGCELCTFRSCQPSEATETTVRRLTNDERKSLVDANILDAGETSNYKGKPTDLFSALDPALEILADATLPKGQDIVVQQSYVPVVGGRVGVRSGMPDLEPEARNSYRQRIFAQTSSFLRAARDLYRHNGADNAKMFSAFEQYLSYIITSAATGLARLAAFRLVVDMGRSQDAGFILRQRRPGEEISSTQFELDIKDYAPTHDIDVLLLKTHTPI